MQPIKASRMVNIGARELERKERHRGELWQRHGWPQLKTLKARGASRGAVRNLISEKAEGGRQPPKNRKQEGRDHVCIAGSSLWQLREGGRE